MAKREEEPMVEVPMNDEEVADAARLLAVAVKEEEDLAEEWSAQKKEHSTALSNIKGRIHEYGEQVRTRRRLEPAQHTL